MMDRSGYTVCNLCGHRISEPDDPRNHSVECSKSYYMDKELVAIKTTKNDVFTFNQCYDLARLIYIRFGENINSAHGAWCRMLQNNCSIKQFSDLIFNNTHTPNCKGWCQNG